MRINIFFFILVLLHMITLNADSLSELHLLLLNDIHLRSVNGLKISINNDNENGMNKNIYV